MPYYYFFQENDTYKNMPPSFWDNLIKEADKNGDGEIDYDEFISMMDKIRLWFQMIKRNLILSCKLKILKV